MIYIDHVVRVNESCHTWDESSHTYESTNSARGHSVYKWVTSHVWWVTSHDPLPITSVYRRESLRVWMNHVTRLELLRVWMNHVTRLLSLVMSHVSCHTSHVTRLLSLESRETSCEFVTGMHSSEWVREWNLLKFQHCWFRMLVRNAHWVSSLERSCLESWDSSLMSAFQSRTHRIESWVSRNQQIPFTNPLWWAHSSHELTGFETLSLETRDSSLPISLGTFLSLYLSGERSPESRVSSLERSCLESWDSSLPISLGTPLSLYLSGLFSPYISRERGVSSLERHPPKNGEIALQPPRNSRLSTF